MIRSKGGNETPASNHTVYRARIPDGWLLRRSGEDGITFVPFQGKGGW
jgi:hypothetical protein